MKIPNIKRELNIKVKPFINKNNNQVTLAIRKRDSKSFMKIFPKIKDKDFINLKYKWE